MQVGNDKQRKMLSLFYQDSSVQFITTSKRSFFPFFSCRNRNEHNRVANEWFKETFLRRKVGESKRVFSKEGRTSPRIPPFKAHSHFPRKSDESSLGVRVEEAHLRGQVIRNVVAKNCKKQR